jgi:RIO1 family
MTYLAETTQGERVFLKFTRTYSQALHVHCASAGHAPTLRACQRLPGGWLMIVMDIVDLSVYKPFSEIPLTERQSVTSKLLPALEKLVVGFHNVELVHGDIRRPNILVHDSDFLLIDYDWGGDVGVVRYPSLVNHFGILPPEGARDGELITKEHDLFMLRSQFTTS